MLLDSDSNNKRIAKNAIALYVRMFIATIVSLYTSRVVLSTLGTSDYGVYSLVGGIVVMFGFLNVSMSGATSRFLTFELGKGNSEQLAKIFNAALWVHICIALIVILLSETVGLWFLNYKLVIPEESRNAAQWVYQFSILSSVIGITQVPYNASIIAHEKMNIYAYVEILNTVLKLLIVYLLVLGNFNKLILYAILVLGVSLIVAFIYRLYCVKKFNECHFKWQVDKKTVIPMLSFSGWDLYGNGCSTAKVQCSNFFLNIFFGVVINAASGIATTVTGVISGFSNNIIMAFRPAIIKAFSQNDFANMQKLMNNALKYSLLLLSIFVIPITLQCNFVFSLWLGNVPDYSVIFCQLLLVNSFFSTIHYIFNAGIHATGRIKNISLYVGTLQLLQLPFIYLAFVCNGNPIWAYIVNLIMHFVITIVLALILHKSIPQLSMRVFIRSLIIVMLTIGVASLTCFYLSQFVDNKWWRFIAVFVSYIVFVGIVAYAYLIDKEMMKKIKLKFMIG